MIVIADSSPIIVLVNIGHIDVLPTLFGSVTIPCQVAEELASASRPQGARDFIARPPAWLAIRQPSVDEPISRLQSGETAAIHLAKELNADLLLVDDMQARRAAAGRNIKLTGSIGVLEMAASAKLLKLETAFDLIKQTDFWISHKLLDESLRLFHEQQARRES
jgi:predicted nucleic acid-binding protein